MIEAVLKEEVSYTGFDGKIRTLKEGEVVYVTLIKKGTVYVGEDGIRGIIAKDRYAAVHGNDMLDIEQHEFKMID